MGLRSNIISFLLVIKENQKPVGGSLYPPLHPLAPPLQKIRVSIPTIGAICLTLCLQTLILSIQSLIKSKSLIIPGGHLEKQLLCLAVIFPLWSKELAILISTTGRNIRTIL